MKPNILNKKTSFTYIELMTTLVIMAVIAGGLMATMSSFNYRQQLDIAIFALVGDLRYTQQLSRVQSDGYKYYGLRFYSGLGTKGDCIGYKIVRYEPPGGTQPIDLVPPVNFTTVTVMKSPILADNPRLVENTFFARDVKIDTNSEFQVTPTAPKQHSIVFTPEGSATIDGLNLLTVDNDKIILNLKGKTKSIEIVSLTGNVKIQ